MSEPFASGQRVRSLNLDRKIGTVEGSSVSDAEGKFTYSVRWDDGSASENVVHADLEALDSVNSDKPQELEGQLFLQDTSPQPMAPSSGGGDPLSSTGASGSPASSTGVLS